MTKPLGRITKMSEITDNQIRQIHSYLIAKAWESGDTFDVYQKAWKTIASILGIVEIEDNGQGRVRWVGRDD